VLAEEHRIVARRLGVKTTVAAVIRFQVIAVEIRAVAMDPIEHGLDASRVACKHLRTVAKETGGYMFDRIEPETIALRGV